MSDATAGGDATARIVAPARRSLRPQTLVPVHRLAVLERAFQQRDRQSGRRLVMITGEGGIGKSVLLGQLLNDIEADPGAGGAVLVACGDVHLTGTQSTRDQVDDAFGAAAGERRLLGALARLRTEFTRVTLLVDTLDLLVGPDTVQPIAAVLAEALTIGDVYVTCRHDEYQAYFRDAAQAVPQLTGLIVHAPLPPLAPEEVVGWARRYVETREPDAAEDNAEASAFLETLRTDVWRDGAIRDVCAIPLRLRLICEVFADQGHLPEDLTVTGLYDEYWASRVARHGGRRSANGDAKESAALAIAAELLDEDGHLALGAPKRRLDDRRLPGLRLLASEGVLLETRAEWQFFHQSFAEYAVARWMLSEGARSDPIARLARHLRAGQTRLWTIAGSVLTQVEPDDLAGYTRLAQVLRLDSLQAAKAHTVAALRQRDPAALASVVDVVRESPELWPAVLPDLGKAPREVVAVPGIVAGALAQSPGTLAGPVAAAFASLADRARPGRTAAVLGAALAAFRAERPRLDAKLLDQHVSRVVGTQQRVLPAEALDLLPDYLRTFGSRYGQCVVRVFLANADRLAEEQVTAFGRAVLAVTAPPLEDAEAVALVRLLWSCAPLRAERGWHTWRELITDTLPDGLWHNAVVRFAADLAASDQDVRAEVVDDLLQGNGAGTAHVNVFEHVAAANAEWVAERLLGTALPESKQAVGAIASAAARFRPPTAYRLADWLSPARDRQPRIVWPAQITLLGGAIPRQAELFAELTRTNPPGPVLDSAVDAWLFRTTPQVLDELTPQLRAILRGPGADVLQTRARLEGHLALRDADARAWIAEQLLDGPSPRIASTAVKTIADEVRSSGVPVSRPVATWLTGLLATRHHDACRRTLDLLGKAEYTDEETFADLAGRLVPTLAQKFQATVRDDADAQLTQAVLDCLVRADNNAPIDRGLVRSMFDALRAYLAAGTPKAAAVWMATNFCGTLLARRLDVDEVRERVDSLVTAFDPGAVSNKSVRAVAVLLGGVVRRDPAGPGWLEELFWRDGTALGTRLAIAETLLNLDDNRATSRAAHLSERAGCPTEVIAYVLPRLRG
jgi:hypothetical protein